MERYSIVFDGMQNIYAKDTKLVIERAVLTKDNDTGKVFAQIKMSNLLPKTLIAVKVSLTGYDVAGTKLEETKFTYLDITVAQGEVFGQKTPVDFQNSTVRSFDIKITETVYYDGSKCNDGGSGNYAIPSPKKLSSELSFSEINQYKIDNTQNYYEGESINARYIVDEFSDIWRCTCGRLNTADSDCCYSCGASRENLKRTFDKNLLDEEIKENFYKKAIDTYQPGNRYDIEAAIKRLKTIEGYKDSERLITQYEAEIAAINNRKAADEAKARSKKIGFAGIIALLITAILLFYFLR